ncbi:Protein csh3 [Escovopsis weberi]|uniref:Protein csh3 n=1 Tax=Escovopsis weberi TaxID=150374 RepID=A0A0M9VWS8_ESCWE|nr:Protein csh3 [Escovopsis weberi]
MDRQTIMETNRSLRSIKTELENLLEKGVITDAAYDAIHAALPAETPLRGATVARSNPATPSQSSAASTPPPARAQPQGFPHTSQPAAAAAAAAAPPSYEDTPAPSLPTRATGKPILSHARALYRYQGMDPRDLSFEKDDEIHVFEHMNADWWLGRNARTGREGIFPQNYVLVDPASKAAAGGYAPQQQQQPAYGYPAQQQQQQNPYNSSVPPMAVAEGGQAQGAPEAGGQGHGKVGEYGKKFGKKLGNAAVFGAGATIGSNLVNSIF